MFGGCGAALTEARRTAKVRKEAVNFNMTAR